MANCEALDIEGKCLTEPKILVDGQSKLSGIVFIQRQDTIKVCSDCSTFVDDAFTASTLYALF